MALVRLCESAKDLDLAVLTTEGQQTQIQSHKTYKTIKWQTHLSQQTKISESISFC